MNARGFRRMVVVVAALVGPLLAAPLARAEGPAARTEAGKEFRRGEAAFKNGAYAEAADAFEHAYAIAPQPAALFNAAEARQKAGQPARAARLYVRVLADRETAPKDREDAARRMVDLNARLARLAVVAQGGQSITIDGETATADDTYTDPGDHVVVVAFASGPVTRKVNAAPGVRTRVVIEPVAAVVAAPIVATMPSPDQPQKPLAPAWFFAAAGVTVALGAGTIASGLDANAARTAFDKAPTTAGLDAGQGKVTRTNVLLVSTAVVGVATAALGIFAVRWKSNAASNAARVLRLEGSFE